MHLEAGIQTEESTMLDDILHGSECTLVLVRLGDLATLLASTVAFFAEQHGDLGAEFTKLERTGNNCNAGASSRACSTKGCHGPGSREGTLRVHVAQNVDTGVLLEPLTVNVLGFGVDGEGRGSDYGNAEHGRSDTYDELAIAGRGR